MFLVLITITLVAFVGFFVNSYRASSADRFTTNLHSETADLGSLERKIWWAKKRRKYNIGLIFAGFTAFFAYAILGEILIAPYDREFEITLFTTLFQGIGYLFMVLLANLFYNLGVLIDQHYNKDNNEIFRKRLFNLGFWFSVGLPFLIPTMILVVYFARFAKNN